MPKPNTPCPKCQQLRPDGAAQCECGHRFAEAAPEPTGPEAIPCPRCGARMVWGASKGKEAGAAWGCLFSIFVTVVKMSFLNLMFRPVCPNDGKISKLEIIRQRGEVPGVFWLWGIVVLIGGPLVIAAAVSFLMAISRPR